MKCSALIFACLTLAGCALSLSDLAYENQSNIANLSIGMPKAEVLKVMGRKPAETKDGLVANPFKIETFQDRTGAQYEVLYYVTERNRRLQPLRLGNATPLIIKDNVLTGWGQQALSKVRTTSR